MPMVHQVGLAIALLLTYLLYWKILRPTIFSPLFRIPAAHPTAHFSSWWLARNRPTGTEARSVFAAHQRCGPVVRLAPNEVSITSQEGLRKVYFSSLSRTDWALAFRNYDGTPNLVTLLDPREHATRRRMLSNLFSKSYLLNSADFCDLSQAIIFGRLLPMIDKAARDGSGVDVFEISTALAAEVMSAYQVGLKRGFDFTSPGRETSRKRHLENGKKKLGDYAKMSHLAAKELEEECFQMCVETEEFLRLTGEQKKPVERPVQEGSTLPTTTNPVTFARLSTDIPAKEGDKSAADTLRLIASELLDHLEAARVGIGITVTYAMYQLSQRPKLQSQLRAELMALPVAPRYPSPGLESKSVLQQIDKVGLLDATVMETLRVHPSAPGPQPRSVPEGGVVIDGYFIPAGVFISTSPYFLHQNRAAYPDPDKWQSERWMKGQNTKAEHSVNDISMGQEMEEDDPRRWFWAFGRGGRMCVGSNFALITTKVILASVYTSFTTTIIDDEGVEQRDSLPADPVGDKLILGFSRV
ncbi:cytochrome P450 [Periconia macrospinosa]|uniref:Cytochrome P450 n=1 Tax=Periconia macrospinosa TaxID=97972 RepID=A0A2V1DU49_9PLEO|nr:cytochrome P450 [Periconia macrospinosa]